MVLAGTFVDDGTLFERGSVQAGMALCRGGETNGPVAVLVVVPVLQIGDPAACGQQVCKRPDWSPGAVRESGPKWGLRCHAHLIRIFRGTVNWLWWSQ